MESHRTQTSIKGYDLRTQNSKIRLTFRKPLQSLNLEPGLLYHIEWVPGHMDIHGNDIADEEAKRAAKEKIQGDPPIRVHKLKSAQNMTINIQTAKETNAAWNSKRTT